MNTIAHMLAMVALLWLGVDYGYGTLAEPNIGFVFSMMFFLWIPLTFKAVLDDIHRAGRKDDGE